MKKLLAYVLFALSLLCVALRPEAQEIRRPTAEADDTTSGACSAASHVSQSMPNFYDAGGVATYSDVTLEESSSSGVLTQRKFSSWASSSTSYSALVLKVNSSCDIAANFGVSQCSVQYTINGGSTWQTLYTATTTRTQATATITLSPSQNLSQLQVRSCIVAIGDDVNASNVTLSGFDIWTEGIITKKRKHHVGTWR